MGFANSFLGESFLTLWDGDCEFLGCRKAFFLHRGGASNARLFISFRLPIHFKRRDTKRGGKERERERHRERESEIEETDKNSHQVLEIDETWCDLHSWLFATTTSSA